MTFARWMTVLCLTLFLSGLLGCSRTSEAVPKGPLEVRLDAEGPTLILATQGAADAYGEAMDIARRLHPGAGEGIVDPADPAWTAAILQEHRPRYALVFILPDELDVNFAWRWLTISSEVDEDPFVDVRTGFITGETPEAAAAFMKRIAEAASGGLSLPGLLVDNLGPNAMAQKDAFDETPKSFFLPAYEGRMGLKTISHGTQGFTRERMDSMAGAGLVHLGGHGYPDRIVDGLNGPWVRKLSLSPCVVFNGACYTGVTGRWFETMGTVREQNVPPQESFCLGILGNQAVGYLAALHPDHGIPVYQEMEFLAFEGASLGDVMKHTHDGVILAGGGQPPEFEVLADGLGALSWTPAEYMLKGTAARVLFGDPALVPMKAFSGAPFETALARSPDGAWTLTATLRNDALKATFTDTYYSDMSAVPNQFNDRARLAVELPENLSSVASVEVLRAEASGKSLKHRLVGWAVEEDAGKRILHVQVDVPTTAYMESEFRHEGAQLELKLTATDSP